MVSYLTFPLVINLPLVINNLTLSSRSIAEQIINLQTSSFLQFLWNLVNLSVIRVLLTSKDYFSPVTKNKHQNYLSSSVPDLTNYKLKNEDVRKEYEKPDANQCTLFFSWFCTLFLFSRLVLQQCNINKKKKKRNQKSWTALYFKEPLSRLTRFQFSNTQTFASNCYYSFTTTTAATKCVHKY